MKYTKNFYQIKLNEIIFQEVIEERKHIGYCRLSDADTSDIKEFAKSVIKKDIAVIVICRGTLSSYEIYQFLSRSRIYVQKDEYMSKKIAFFDFDGTITIDDSLLKFIRFIVGLLFLSPMLVWYKLKFIPNYKAKQYLFSSYFKNMKKEDFFEVANKYSLNHIDKIVRKKAMDRINWHKKQGHKIVVSVSIDCWLRPWFNINNLELIATKLDFSEDKIIGKFITKNCYGQEKVNRINETYNLKEFNYIYAYGDSSGDREILAIANEKYYKPFRD